MIYDDEFDVLVTAPDRIKALGFKPQKEILINHLLPYADELDKESLVFLEHVKTNLAKAVMLREMKPACGVWTSRLMKYIQIHGLKFSKEDHIALIKLTYELVIIPDLEPCKVHKFATLFLLLTKKRQYVSPEELTLPWRPLYEIAKKIFDRSTTHIGMYHYLKPNRDKQGVNMLELIRKLLSDEGLGDAMLLFGLTPTDENKNPTTLDASFMAMVKYARPYFDMNATKEILAEFLPKLNPWSSNNQVLYQLAAFLPVSLPPEHADKGHLLWFDELMALWDTCQNAPCGISELMVLFAGLAKRNPGTIDWRPHVPKIFARLLHGLNLPVSYKDIQYHKCHSLDMKRVASWIVWTINPDGVVLKHLRSFLTAVESYLHNANSGKWSHKLRDLLRKLAREFLNRVRREREKKFTRSWENRTPKSYCLRDEDITEFVNILLKPTQEAVYNRSGAFDITVALQNLATLRPAIVIPPLLDRLRSTLTSLTEPHRVTAAMSAVASVARAMLRGGVLGYPEGQTHVVPFLMAILPGIDPNDIKKTIVTLHYILIFSWMVPFIDCSSAHEHWTDLTEEELLTCESTAQMEDFVLVFLDRLFVIIESSSMEHVRLDTKESDNVRSKTDLLMETAIAAASTAIIMQSSPKIYQEALRKFKKFATENTFETTVSGSMVGVLLRVFARTNPEATLSAFLPQICEELGELLSTDEALHDENPSRDVMYRLVILKYLVQCDGDVLRKYMPLITPVLDRGLKLHATYALTRACDVLSNILTSLCFIDLREWKSSPKDYGEAPEKWLPIRHWGVGCDLSDLQFKWYIPTQLEADCAQMLIDRYLNAEVIRLQQWLSNERDMSRDRRLRSLYIINASLACSTYFPLPDEEPVVHVDSQVPPTSIPFTSGTRYEVRLNGENVRVAMTQLLLDVQARLLADKTDDTRGLEVLILVWEKVVAQKSYRTGPSLEARFRSYAALERALEGHGGPTSSGMKSFVRLRMLAADAARIHDDIRSDLICESGITQSALKGLHALVELSTNTYSTVRMLAQVRLYSLLSHYPFSYRAIVPLLGAQLAAGGEGDEWHAKHKGIMFMMLGPRASPLLVKQDWEAIRVLWPAVLNAPVSEKPSMVRLEQAVCDTLHRQFPTTNTRLKITEDAVQTASKLLTDSQMSEPQFVEQLSCAVERETASSDKAESAYLELIDELVKVIETPNVQWRRLELAIQMLSFCPSIQTRYPAHAVRAAVRGLIHDNLTVRKTALRVTLYALKQRKHKIKKIFVDPYEIAGIPRPEKHVPGYRKDLDWALWSDNYVPLTDEDWEKPWMIDCRYGFYTWPEKLEVAAPPSEQRFSSDLSAEEMEDGERFIYEFFTDQNNVDKFVNFLTVEEKKAKEKFNGSRFSLFKHLFSQYGESVSDKFMAHALRCAKSSSTQDVQQRFAAEVMAASLRAPQYWRRERAYAMYQKAVEIIETGLSAVIPETLEDWGIGLVAGVEKLEPSRGRPALDALLALCAPTAPATDTTDSSFSVCARLFALQTVLGAMRWRGAPLAAQLLKRLQDANYIQHPYQNVRETVGGSKPPRCHPLTIKKTDCAQMLIDRYLNAEVIRLQQWLSNERDMSRDRRLRSLYIINASLACSTYFPLPDEEPVVHVDSQVPPTSIPFTSGTRYEVRLNGENVRVAMTQLLLDVQARLLADKTDDTRGLEVLILVWEKVVAQKSYRTGPSLEARFRSYAALERALEGHGGPTSSGMKSFVRLRMLAADAARIHDDIRSDLICESGITQSALKGLHALVELSTNTYSTVRMLAQVRLYSLLSHYPFSYRAIVPLLGAQLAAGGEGDEWHAKHKGIMFMMLGPRASPLLVKQDWEAIRVLWPAVLNAPVSEKPSMVRLEQAVCDTLHRQFPTTNTRLKITEDAVQTASKLLTDSQMSEPQFVEQLSCAVERETASSDKAESAYLELIDELVKVIETPNVQWRRLELAIQMLSFCPSIQTRYPAHAVRAAVRGLIHDNLTVRKTALRVTLYALKQRKHKIKKIFVDPYEIAGIPRPEKHVPGYRKDLDWALWSDNYVPLTDEDWEKPWMIDCRYGFYTWPEKLEVAAPPSEQRFSSDLSAEEMEDGERFIYEFFTDQNNVDKFVNFLTVEEKKAKEKFNGSRFSLFKHLFSQYGESVSDKFMAHALRCAKSSSTQDVQQRFAAEVMAASLRAPQYWRRERAYAMYQKAVEIIETGLSAVIPETLEDWGIGLVAGVEKLEPSRGRPALDALLALCAPTAPATDTTDSSFSVCARLFALQTVLGAMRWRGAPLAAQLLKRLQDANYIQHPYQNVRETVGGMLVTIFDTELVFPGGENRSAPKLVDFLASIQPRLAVLYDENGDIVIKTAASAAAAMQSIAQEESVECAELAPSGPRVPRLVEVARLSPDSSVGEDTAQATVAVQSPETEDSGLIQSRIDQELVSKLDTALRLSGDSSPQAPKDYVHALNLLTVALRTCGGALMRCVGGAGGTLAPYAVLGAACGGAARGGAAGGAGGDELPRAADTLLARLALALHPPHAFHAALQHMHALADSHSWWTRLACLDFAQPLLFYGLPMLCDQQDRAVEAEKFALKLMRDPRLEVRKAAAKLLTGLMHCQALPDEELTIRQLMRSCRSKELVERHCGVLGLCAYLASRPYSLGSRLGDVLAELSRHTSAPDPIPATIRAALADFRRTHQDDWPAHRDQLTEEELDLLTDLTLPPSYCA